MSARILTLALSLAACVGCDGRDRTIAFEGSQSDEVQEGLANDGYVLEFDLGQGAPESMSGDRLLSLPATRTYTGLVRAIERAHHDEEASGYFVRLGTSSFDFARTEEIGRLFGDLRTQTGKKAVCHAQTLDNASTWLAGAACDEVWLSPAGEASTVGIAGQTVYLKGLLEKLHIEAQFLAMGRYKSAVESFTREGSSDASAEALLFVLGDMRSTWLSETAKARAGHDVAESLELGPWDAKEAKAHGLIDAVGFDTEAVARARGLASTRRLRTVFGPKKEKSSFDLTEIVRLVAGAEPSTDRPHVAVVPAEGSISMKSGGLLSDGGITSAALRKVLRRLRDDDAVRAVVIRLDSPGGSPLASDLIWHDLMQLRKTKPVIASIGEMAASGGYYIACAANRVVAEKTSIVGSIGVFGGKIVLRDALAQVGVQAEIFAPSPDPVARERAAYLSPLRSWDEATKERVRAHMRSVYDLFLERVSTGRAMPVEEVRKVAEGRIWTGAQGKERGLVDDLGGLGLALELARSAAGLDADAPVRVEGTTESLLEMLLLGEGADQSQVEAALGRLERRRAVIIERAAPRLRPFIGSLQGLLQGETVIAALPYGVTLQ